MQRNLPPEYAGWDTQHSDLRDLSTLQLIEEIQDGPPDRRLAAIAAIDLEDVPDPTIADWIRTLPDPEANELAGAMPAQRPHASPEADARWMKLARLGYEQRRLPTFLVVLFASVEALETRDPQTADALWADIAPWASDGYRRFAAEGDDVAIDDLLLFVFEAYMDRPRLFEAFVELVAEHAELATRISANPALFLAGLPLEQQRRCLEAAAERGDIPFDIAWQALHNTPLG